MVGVRLVRMRLLMSKGKPSVMIAPAEAAEILIDKRQSKQMVDLALLASIVNLAIFNARNGPKWAYVIAAFDKRGTAPRRQGVQRPMPRDRDSRHGMKS